MYLAEMLSNSAIASSSSITSLRQAMEGKGHRGPRFARVLGKLTGQGHRGPGFACVLGKLI